MEETANAASTSATSSSVSPKALVPSITIVALLVLISVGCAVYLVRTSKKRRAVRLRNDRDLEANQTAHDDVRPPSSSRKLWSSSGTRNPLKSGKLIRDRSAFKPLKSNTADTELRPPTAAYVPGNRPLSSWHKEDKENIAQPPPVSGPRGYVFAPAEDNRPKSQFGIEVTEIGVERPQRTLALSKVERITGNALPHSIYEEERPQHRRGRQTPMSESRSLSYPPLNTSSAAIRPVRDLDLDDPFEISPTDTSSPSSNNNPILNALSPPPTSGEDSIASRYPNVAALSRTNPFRDPPARLTPKRFSSPDADLQPKHIATQYKPSKTQQKQPATTTPRILVSSRPQQQQQSHRSARFPGLDSVIEENGRSTSRPRPSTSSDAAPRYSFLAPPKPLKSQPDHRSSWKGQSILMLDDHELPQKSPKLSTQYDSISSRSSSSSPETSTTPVPRFPIASGSGARTSAFQTYVDPRGTAKYPQPPPPPVPEREDLRRDSLARSASISKASILSTPSSVSSINALTVGPITTFGGLSPTPAPRTSSSPGDNRSERSVKSALSETRSYRSLPKSLKEESSGDSTVLSETSQGMMTEEELQFEMGRIRERAKRASEERRERRRAEERRRMITRFEL